MSKRPYQHLPPLEHRPDGSPLPHNPAPEETSQRPDTPGVLQLRGRKLPCAGRWRHLRLSADDFVLRLLQVVPLGGLAAGQDAGSGDLPGQGLETLCGVRRCVRPRSPTGANTARTAPPEFTGGRKQKVNGKGGLLWTVKSGKSLDLQGLRKPSTGAAGIIYHSPRENGPLTVHKTRYDKHDLVWYKKS